MSRKKATRRKIKTTVAYSNCSSKPSDGNHTQVSSEEFLPDAANTIQAEHDFAINSAPQINFIHQTTLMPKHWNGDRTLGSAVRVKTEPEIELEHQTCSNENNLQCGDFSAPKQASSSNTSRPAKIKRERLSLDSSICSRSIQQFSKTTPTMDLGSHLEQSLSSLQSDTELTWSQLLEAKNLPKVHSPERVQENVSISTEKLDQPESNSTDDDPESQEFGVEKTSMSGRSTTLYGKEKVSLSGAGSSNRFSRNQDGTSGGNLLDRSKKAIPLEIRRVLASKHSAARRNDDGHSGSVVPNFNKSRSRFTHSSKKSGVTDSEDEASNRIETGKSPHLSALNTRKNNERSKEMEPGHTQASFYAENVKLSSSMPKSKSVSPTDYSALKGSIPVAAKLLNKRRFSSSTYEGRGSAYPTAYLPLGNRETATGKLQNRGLVDLGSHYGSLLKDSPPPLTGRNSRSPYEEAASTTALEKGSDATSNTTSFDEHMDRVQEAKRMPQDDLNTGPAKGGSEELPHGVRRSWLGGDLREKSLNRRGGTMHPKDDSKLNDGRLLHVTGRRSRSPVGGDSEARNPGETLIDLGSKHRLDQLKDTLHSSRSHFAEDVTASGTTGGPMIDLNTSTSQLAERVPHVRGRSPFSSSHLQHDMNPASRSSSRSPITSERRGSTPPNVKEGMIEFERGKQSHKYLDSARHAIPRSSSRSPITTERQGNSPSNAKEGMIALGSGKHDYTDSARHTIPRSSSRSPVTTERQGNTPPNAKEGMIALGSRKHDYPDSARHAISRSSSRSPVLLGSTRSPNGTETMIELDHRNSSKKPSRSPAGTDLADNTRVGAMIELSSTSRLIEQQRNTSRSPHSDSGPANTEEPKSPMIDLNSMGHLHERRGAPRMKPLDAMIDLSSMENPTSPLSPGFGALPFSSFPSQVYRPNNRSRYSYRGKAYRPHTPRGTSPGFSPRLPFGPHFNYPPNPRYRMPGAPMIDLGSFGKSNNFQGMVSSRSEIGLRPVRTGAISKRRHSLDSQNSNEPAKKPRMVVPDQRPEVKPGGSGVRLNVNDLLQLEREEQKYIHDLSLAQSQLTEIRFKMQRMQQDMEKLQSSEMEMKQRIDHVRAKRMRILKDAQDHEDSQAGKRTPGVSGDSDKAAQGGTGGDTEGGMAYNRGSLGFQSYHVERSGDVMGSVSEPKHKGTLAQIEGKSTEFRSVYTAGGSASEEKREVREDVTLEKNKNNVTNTDRSGHGESSEQNIYQYGNMSEDRNVAPSELILRASRGTGYPTDTSDSHRPVLASVPRAQHYPVTSSSNVRSNLTRDKHPYPSDKSDPHHPVLSTDAPSVPRTQHPMPLSSNVRSNLTRYKPLEGAEWDRSSQQKISTEVETFESSNGSTITLNSDGTLVFGKNQAESSHLARKRSSPTILEEVCAGVGHTKRTEDGGFTSSESQQFLGCLEITSTTDEPLVAEDDGPKEVLAEKERESLASKLRCDQDRISSTVATLEIEKDDANVGSAGEMDFIGHTDAVCCILPYKGKLFSASADRTVKAFDLKTGDCIKTFEGHELAVNCVQISGGKTDRLFTGANDQTVRAYNVKSGACTHKFSFRGRVMCLHVAFGKLFVGLSSGFVAVIDLKTNECIDQFNCHEPSRISCLSSATEGQRSLLCTGSFDSTISIRDESTGLLLRHIKDHKLTVLCIQVVENILFSGSADTVVQSHNINTGELVRSYTGHTMSVSGLQALGGVLVTSSLDRIIRCFDIKTGDLLQLYGGNTDMIFSLSVFGNMIYTGCRDGRVSGIKLDLRKYHCCKWGDCSLKFGLLNHLKQHVQDHINQTVDFKSCFWEGCIRKFPRGKQLDVIQAATEHILSHVPDT